MSGSMPHLSCGTLKPFVQVNVIRLALLCENVLQTRSHTACQRAHAQVLAQTFYRQPREPLTHFFSFSLVDCLIADEYFPNCWHWGALLLRYLCTTHSTTLIREGKRDPHKRACLAQCAIIASQDREECVSECKYNRFT